MTGVFDWTEPPAQLPPLDAGEVHVWAARLDLPPAELQRLRAFLSAEERERMDRFRRPEDGRRYLAAHGILRCVLGRYLERAPGALVFEAGTRGKPAVASSAGDEPDLRFNLSHAGDRAGIVVALGREVGVDIESEDRAIRPEAIARRHFPADECDALLALPESERRLAFVRSWVCKEAFAKATGLGLGAVSFRALALRAGPGGPVLEGARADTRDLLRGWEVRELPRLDECSGAVAFEQGAAAVHCWLWPAPVPVRAGASPRRP